MACVAIVDAVVSYSGTISTEGLISPHAGNTASRELSAVSLRWNSSDEDHLAQCHLALLGQSVSNNWSMSVIKAQFLSQIQNRSEEPFKFRPPVS